MKSKREIIREYNKLMEDVKTNAYYTEIDLTNRVNCYICDCGHITKTKDVDPGCTPFLFNCEKCGNLAKSNFYNDIAPQLEPTFEWYRPKLEKCLKLRRNEGLLEHILKGGLIDKKIAK